jgi:cell division protein FtsI (penicillin-binding protein 3)
MAERRRKKSGQALRLELPDYRRRRGFLFVPMMLVGSALVAQATYRQVWEKDFLQKEGARRYLRTLEVPADRGSITDRHGELMAVSTPVDSAWFDPREFDAKVPQVRQLEKHLGLKSGTVSLLKKKYQGKGFVYLKRAITPDVAEAVKALQLSGVHLDREYRRYYPAGPVAAHVVGFTDIDDHGQEGLELARNDLLAGKPGAKRVIRDGRRRIVSDVESIKAAEPGQALALSLDLRMQFLAYRELKRAVEKHKAVGGSAVLMDARTGEVLAMVNEPAYNPNDSRARKGGRLRNRALTDLFEPGSTVKPFVVAAALESGEYRPETLVETRPGYLRVGSGTVRDVHNYGLLDVTGVIRKSSNVGVSKIALSLPAKALWGFYDSLGFGHAVNTGFPGERSGTLTKYSLWRPFDQAVISFGYGLSTSTLQLARAYAAVANGGVLPEVTLLRRDQSVSGQRVMRADVARQVRAMLEQVVLKGGTAPRAAVSGYRVGGKTGTVKKAIPGGYSEDKYVSLFAGMAPMSDPRLVLVVMVDTPRGDKYYGGLVAAPVFSRVMDGALRMLNIAPDDQPQAVRMALRKKS